MADDFEANQILSKLRQRALEYRAGDKDAAEELLHLVLATALSDVRASLQFSDVDEWLHGIMREHMH